MLSIEMEAWLRELRMCSTDPDSVELKSNVGEIKEVKFTKSIGSNGISEESIEIVF